MNRGRPSLVHVPQLRIAFGEAHHQSTLRTEPHAVVRNGLDGRVTPDRARRLAQELFGYLAGGDDPAGKRAGAGALPTLGDACEEYIDASHGRAAAAQRSYRRYASLYLGDWLARPLDAITHRDIEARFHRITERHGAVQANQALSFLRSVYRRPCVDYDGLRSGRAVARRGRALPPQDAQADIVAGRGAGAPASRRRCATRCPGTC